jgi:ketosteroid isomerase-like protein
MLTEEHCLRLAMLKSDHCVFPVTDVVAEADVEHSISKVVAVEEEPESVNHTITLVYYNQRDGRITSTTNNLLASEAAATVTQL